jgi:hypothetical protein
MGQTPLVRAWSSLARCVGLLLLIPAVGCGAGQGTVSGRVLYKNTPVPGGLVTFVPADPKQQSVTAILDENGRYELTVASGEVRIGVDNEELRPPAAGAKGPPLALPGVKLPPIKKGDLPPEQKQTQAKNPGKYREIPEKYYRPDTSGLRYTVTGGSQTHDIELK